MSIVVIPDMHGSTNWKCVLNTEYDFLVSLGDWFDGEGTADEQIANFTEFMEYVKEDPTKRFSLIGNHDFQYMVSTDSYTTNAQLKDIPKIKAVLQKYQPFLRVIVSLFGVVFSHAGVTKTWMKHNAINQINANAFTFKPLMKALSFNRRDLCTDDCGDDVYQSPLWVRPPSLLKDSAFEFQVVGHTCMARNGEPVFARYKDKHVVFLDSSTRDCIVNLDVKNIRDMNWKDVTIPPFYRLQRAKSDKDFFANPYKFI